MAEVTAPEHLYKQPYEKRKYLMDFGNLLELGEIILSTGVITSERIGGGGESDLSITSAAVISGSGISMWIESGTHNWRYRVEIRVQTSGGANLEGDGILVVKDR